MAKRTKPPSNISIEALRHDSATRRNNPTMELQSFLGDEEAKPIEIKFERRFNPDKNPELYARNPDLDPQLVWAPTDDGGGAVQLTWKGKDDEDREPLTVEAVPIYTAEKIHPKAIIDDIRRRAASGKGASDEQTDLFADFNGIDEEDRLDFYQHDQHWTNRMILGDSLQVMASLAANKEALRGKVQCIFMDPPYGIKFNSNWQVSTRDRDVKDGRREFQSREPEVVRAFRDTWANGIHSYLSYLRDRFRLAHELLSSSGSFFLQIGAENLHLCKLIAKEVFGDENFIAQISFLKTTSATSGFISSVSDYIIWFAKDASAVKYRPLYKTKEAGGNGAAHYSSLLLADGFRRPLTKSEKRDPRRIPEGAIPYTADQLQSAGMGRDKGEGAASWFKVAVEGRTFTPTMQSRWKTNEVGMERLVRASRVIAQDSTIRFLRKINDFPAYEINNIWTDVGGASDKRYVVETAPKIVERCILMTTDPGDLVLDPTCGSGTTAYVAEQWGRRWITIDTSRVALTLARSRIMGARYPFYALKDSEVGAITDEELRLQRKLTLDEANAALARGPFTEDIANGFVYHRVPHVTLKSIANNSEIDVIWMTFQSVLEPLLEQLNKTAREKWEEWQVPRSPVYQWAEKAIKLHGKVRDLLDERTDLVANWDRGASEIVERDVEKHDKKIAKALKELPAGQGRSERLCFKHAGCSSG
jgi:adenine-specific DNA-methyltransferase